MNTPDQEILSTFIEFMRSLEETHSPSDDICSFEDETMILVKTNINEPLYNNIFLKKHSAHANLIPTLRQLKQSMALPLTVWVTAETEHQPETQNLLHANFKSPGSFYPSRRETPSFT